jgi:hypothetical protein
MRKIKELAGGCLLAVCVAAIGAAFVAREAWRLVRPGDSRALDAPVAEPAVDRSRQAHSMVARFSD